MLLIKLFTKIHKIFELSVTKMLHINQKTKARDSN
jgi:hypothetical protein